VLASFVGVLFIPALFVAFETLGERTMRLIRRSARHHHPAE
jgi:hypothetical protein